MPEANDDRYEFRLPSTEKALFARAADSEGMTLALWLRRVAKAAARKVLGDGGEKKRKGAGK
jgi:uncharacterized protein (DUF1778 family)